MDVLIAGMPGPLLRWTCDLAAAAAALVDRPVACVAVGGDDTWVTSLEPAPAAIRLFVAHESSGAVASAVRDGRLTALLVIDDPALALLDLLRFGHPSDVAFRSLSAAATVLRELAGGPMALFVTVDAAEPVRDVQARVLDHLGLKLRPEELADLAWRFGDRAPDTTMAEALAVFHPQHGELTAPEVAVVQAALVPACRYAMTGQRTPVVWPRSCLFWGDRPGEPAPRVLELTGPSRVLIYGPYFRLPPGRWTARATIAFSPSCSNVPFTLEMHGSAEFGRSRFRVEQPGVFIVACAVTVPSAREPLEVRVVSQEGAIDGRLGIDRVELRPEPE